jgi:outer membrane protein assembly factor BamB
MLNRAIIYLLTVFSFMACNQGGGEVSQWRGPHRDGIYPDKGLLKKWPANGPDLLWSFEGLGAGFGSPSFSKDRIFVLGMPDSTGVLYAFDLSGKLCWEKTYGPEWHVSYIGVRSTPTVVGGLVYFESGAGVVYCYDGNTGEKRWSVDLLKKYDAKNIEWGMTESLLIDGNYIICTPGGAKNNIVALDRYNGETIWTSPGNGEIAAFCSPILVKYNNASLIVTITSGSIIGVDSETGKCYWHEPQTTENKIQANSPVYSDGRIYCCSASEKPNSGLVSLKLSEDGKDVSLEWRAPELTPLIGGIIVKDGFIYGSKFNKRAWYCIDAKSGKVQYSTNILGGGSLIQADSLLYCYSDDGVMALVDANPSSFKLISSYKISKGTDQHWAHPVIHEGTLYMRHGNALMAYNIKGN